MTKLKKIIFLSILICVVSCSSTGVRKIKESEVLGKDEVIQIGIQGVEKKYGETVYSESVGIYKKGYRDWKVILYGKSDFYLVFVSEDGKIISVEKGSY
ncbi:hypothetical protein [Leptotrichia sp. OH3620_COT-345]|uniref:hypothetical protein n=1 Tax=Leptotrichia sp. OH3620_COT-345 TaxID=2491048 RepID=UPI001F47F3F7|nr:hypothetical protein [Leptotrichia sp. OH3620_COT-345]